MKGFREIVKRKRDFIFMLTTTIDILARGRDRFLPAPLFSSVLAFFKYSLFCYCNRGRSWWDVKLLSEDSQINSRTEKIGGVSRIHRNQMFKWLSSEEITPTLHIRIRHTRASTTAIIFWEVQKCWRVWNNACDVVDEKNVQNIKKCLK